MKITNFVCSALLLLFAAAAGTVHAQNSSVFRVTNVNLDLKDVPDCKSSGFRIAYVANIGLNAGNIAEAPYKLIPSELNKLNADIILFGGDVFDSQMQEYLGVVKPYFLKWAKGIKQPPMGIYAVCGNGEKCTQLRQLLTAAGFKVPASGSFTALKKSNKILYLFTTATRSPEKTQEKALREVDRREPTIVLSQFPDAYEALHNDRVSLTLSSRPNKDGAFSDESGLSNTFSRDSKWEYGMQHDERKTMFITCGFQDTKQNSPEIVLITLK